MKNLILLSLVTLSICSNAFASSKICYGSTQSQDTKGLVITAEISTKTITLKTIKGDSYNGTYPTYNSIVRGRDGKIYLEYQGENSDYQDVILVDQDLLSDYSTGLLQIRARGEGFFNSVFVCRDQQK